MNLPTLEKQTVSIEYPSAIPLGEAMWAFMVHVFDRGLEPIGGSIAIESVPTKNTLKETMEPKRRITASTVKRRI